jgi:hypothetical protein
VQPDDLHDPAFARGIRLAPRMARLAHDDQLDAATLRAIADRMETNATDAPERGFARGYRLMAADSRRTPRRSRFTTPSSEGGSGHPRTRKLPYDHGSLRGEGVGGRDRPGWPGWCA